MLRITVEIVPYGDENMAREIGKGYIINDGSGDSNKGNYDCTFIETDKNKRTSKKLKDFDRNKGLWTLIRESLKN